MSRICARCKKQLSSSEELDLEQDITHGVCSVCAARLTGGDIPESIKAVIEMVDEPVMLINSLGVVKTANENGLRFLGKKLGAVENRLGGDVFGCAYATRPEGCGKTEHCRTCAIRNIVMDTIAHGRGYNKAPAFQKLKTPLGEKIVRFFISTEKLGDHVLLRIDDADDMAMVS